MVMDLNNFESRWTTKIASKGYIQVPNCVVTCQSQMGLSNTESWLLIHLLQYWWYKGNLPYPSVKTIATRMNKGESSIRKNLASLEKKGAIKRIYRTGNTNQYDVSALIHKLATHFCQTRGKNIKRGKAITPTPPYEIITTKVDAVQEKQIIDIDNKTNSVIGSSQAPPMHRYEESPSWYKVKVSELANDKSINKRNRIR